VKDEIFGQPVWLWLIGAGVVVVGVWYFKNHSSSSAPGNGQPSGQQSPYGNTTFIDWAKQHQGAPAAPPTPTPKPKPKKK
jgi:hypothetical protein